MQVWDAVLRIRYTNRCSALLGVGLMFFEGQWLEIHSWRQDADDVPRLKVDNLITANELDVRGVVIEDASITSRCHLSDAHPHPLNLWVAIDGEMKHQLGLLSNIDVLPIPLVRQLERLWVLLLKLNSINEPELGREILH